MIHYTSSASVFHTQRSRTPTWSSMQHNSTKNPM